MLFFACSSSDDKPAPATTNLDARVEETSTRPTDASTDAPSEASSVDAGIAVACPVQDSLNRPDPSTCNAVDAGNYACPTTTTNDAVYGTAYICSDDDAGGVTRPPMVLTCAAVERNDASTSYLCNPIACRYTGGSGCSNVKYAVDCHGTDAGTPPGCDPLDNDAGTYCCPKP